MNIAPELDVSELGPEAAFRAYLKAGRFMIQRARSSGTYVFYPRIAVPGTGEGDLEWVTASGKGTIHAATVNRSREVTNNIILVDLDEGPRMMSRLDGGEPVIGTRVEARIIQELGEQLIIFRPIERV